MIINILGNGSWGSALAIALSHVAKVILWGRNAKDNDEIIQAYPNIQLTQDFTQVINGEITIFATSLSGFREVTRNLKAQYELSQIPLPDIIWTCKGFEPETGLLPHQIIVQECGSLENIGALLGPSFAREVAIGLPTAITLSSSSSQSVLRWVSIFNKVPYLKAYANYDLIGAEISAGFKNVIAIGSGIIEALSLGFNARAAFITRSLSELARLVKALGGDIKTIYGLTGVGDLILTCTGDLSRNRRVGIAIGKGEDIDKILASMDQVAEGVNATYEIYKLSQKLNLYMPIVSAIYSILKAQTKPQDIIDKFLSQDPKCEIEDL